MSSDTPAGDPKVSCGGCTSCQQCMPPAYTVTTTPYPTYKLYGMPQSTKTMNKWVAATPFVTRSVEKVIKGGILMVEKKVNLQELTVVFDSSEGLRTGQKIHVKGDLAIQPWAKEVYELEGKQFILVPESAIMVVTNG